MNVVMRLSAAMVLATFASLSWSSRAGAEIVVYESGFESPEYSTGALVGQNDWVGGDGDGALIVSTSEPEDGGQSVEILGTGLVPDGFDGGTRVGQAFRTVTLDTSAPIVEVSADLRLDGPELANPYGSVNIRLDNLADPNAAIRQIGQVRIAADGKAYVYDVANNSWLFETDAPLGAYHTVTIRADYQAGTAEYLLNGNSLGTTPLGSASTLEPLLDVTLAMVTLDDGNLINPQLYNGFIDNLRVTVVPEPTAAILLGLGGLSALGIVRARRARR